MTVASVIQPFVGETGGLISALRAVQSAFGCLPDGTEETAADLFNLSRAEVKGVVSFYADFRKSPAAGVVVRVCEAEACQSVGCRDLSKNLKFQDAVGPAIDVEPVYCLGLCSVGPAAEVDGRLIGRATPDKVLHAVKQVKQESPQ